MKKLFSVLFSIAFLLVFVSFFSQSSFAAHWGGVCKTYASDPTPADTCDDSVNRAIKCDISTQFWVTKTDCSSGQTCQNGACVTSCTAKGGTCYGGYSCGSGMTTIYGYGGSDCSGVCCGTVTYTYAYSCGSSAVPNSMCATGTNPCGTGNALLYTKTRSDADCGGLTCCQKPTGAGTTPICTKGKLTCVDSRPAICDTSSANPVLHWSLYAACPSGQTCILDTTQDVNKRCSVSNPPPPAPPKPPTGSAPSAPTLGSASCTGTTATLSWTNGTGATTHQAYYCDQTKAAAAGGCKPDDGSIDRSRWFLCVNGTCNFNSAASATGLINGDSYKWLVAGYNATGHTNSSIGDFTCPTVSTCTPSTGTCTGTDACSTTGAQSVTTCPGGVSNTTQQACSLTPASTCNEPTAPILNAPACDASFPTTASFSWTNGTNTTESLLNYCDKTFAADHGVTCTRDSAITTADIKAGWYFESSWMKTTSLQPLQPLAGIPPLTAGHEYSVFVRAYNGDHTNVNTKHKDSSPDVTFTAGSCATPITPPGLALVIGLDGIGTTGDQVNADWTTKTNTAIINGQSVTNPVAGSNQTPNTPTRQVTLTLTSNGGPTNNNPAAPVLGEATCDVSAPTTETLSWTNGTGTTHQAYYCDQTKAAAAGGCKPDDPTINSSRWFYRTVGNSIDNNTSPLTFNGTAGPPGLTAGDDYQWLVAGINANGEHTNSTIGTFTAGSCNGGNLITATGNVTFVPSGTNVGKYTGTIPYGNTVAAGTYTVKVTVDGHLTKLVPGSVTVVDTNTTVTVPDIINLVAGDIATPNVLAILDYNVLLSCINDSDYKDIDGHALCNQNANYKARADLEDNNAWDKFDYNLFIREFSKIQAGD